jgi:hypothetical protein
MKEVRERSQEYIDYCMDYYKFYHGQSNEDKDFDYCLYYEYYSQFTGDDQEQEGEDGSVKEDADKGKDQDENGGSKPGEKRKREEACEF